MLESKLLRMHAGDMVTGKIVYVTNEGLHSRAVWPRMLIGSPEGKIEKANNPEKQHQLHP